MDPSALGRRLREFRHARRLSLVEVADGAGISSSFLSLVEQGKSDITISRLMRLANFFRVELAELIEPDGAGTADPVVVRHDRPAGLSSMSEGVEMSFVAPGKDHDFGAAAVTVYAPGSTVEVEGGFGDEVFSFILSGTFQLEIEGAAPVTLEAGDAVLYRMHRPHRWRNVGQHEGRVLAIGKMVR